MPKRINYCVAVISAVAVIFPISGFAQTPKTSKSNPKPNVASIAKSKAAKEAEARRKAVDERFKRAVDLQLKGKLDEAIPEYKFVIKNSPDAAPAYLNLALIYLQKKDEDSAIPLMKKAAHLDPKNFSVRAELARVYMGKGKVDEAMSYAQKAVQLNPKHAPSHFILGMGYVEKKKISSAAASFRRVIELDPKDDLARMQLANCYMELKEYDKALAQYEKLVAASPKDVELRKQAATAAQLAKKPETAVKHLNAVREKEPNDIPTLLALAESYDNAGDIKKAKAVLEKTLAIDKKNFIALFNLGRIAFLENDFESARKRFAEAAAARPDDIRSKLNLALANHELGNLDEAARLYDKVLVLDPKNKDALLGLIGTYQYQAKYDEMIAKLRTLASVDPKNAINYRLEIAGAYVNQKKFDEAMAECEAILEKNPNSVEAMLGIADIHRQEGRTEDALSMLRKAAELPQPKHNLPPGYDIPTPNDLAADLLAEQNRYDDAVQEYNASLKKNPNSRIANAGLARMYERQGKYKEAMMQWHKMKQLDPESLEPYQKIAALYVAQQNYQMAVNELEVGLKRFPKNRTLLEAIANTYREQKSYNKAIAKWREIDAMFPEGNTGSQPAMPSMSPLDQIADILVEERKFDEARAEYDILLKKNPKDTKAIRGMAIVYEKEQKFDEAIAQWKKIAEIEPDNPEPSQRIAGIYLAQVSKDKSNYDKAAEVYQAMLKKDPKNFMAVHSLVNIYVQNKNYDEGIALLRKVQKDYPDDAERMRVTDQIADILCLQEKFDEAAEEFVPMLKKDPKSEIGIQGLVRVYTSANKGDAKIEAWRKLLQIYPDDLTPHLEIAQYYYNEHNNYELSASEYETYLKKKPNDTSARVAAARVYDEKLGNKEQALLHYREAGKEAPTFIVDAGRMLQDMGRMDEARAEYQRAIKADPQHYRGYAALGKLYLAENKIDQAIAELKKAVSVKDTGMDPLQTLKQIYISRGNYDEAIELQKRMSEKYPKQGDIMDLGKLYEKAGQIEKASIEYRKQIAANDARAPHIRAELARMLLQNNRLESALGVYTDMEKDPRTKVDGIKGKADVYAKQGKKDLAIAGYKSVLKSYPGYLEVIDKLGVIYGEQGKQDEFLTFLKSHIQASKDSAPYDTLMIKFREADKMTEGLTFLQNLSTERPNDANLKITIGRWTAEAGDVNKAIEIYRSVIDGSKHDPGPGVRRVLAELCEKAGRLEEAAEEYAKCVDQAGSSDLRLKYGALLEKLGRNDDALRQYIEVKRYDPANDAATEGIKRIDASALDRIPPPPSMEGVPGIPGVPGMPGFMSP